MPLAVHTWRRLGIKYSFVYKHLIKRFYSVQVHVFYKKGLIKGINALKESLQKSSRNFEICQKTRPIAINYIAIMLLDSTLNPK